MKKFVMSVAACFAAFAAVADRLPEVKAGDSSLCVERVRFERIRLNGVEVAVKGRGDK